MSLPPPAPHARFHNPLAVVTYAEAVHKGASTGVVVIDRAALRALTKLAKSSAKFCAAEANARRLAKA